MKSVHTVDDWLLQEAHVIAGEVFGHNDLSCLPVSPDKGKAEVNPIGFLILQSEAVNFVSSDSPEGQEILKTWQVAHRLEQLHKIPAECWFG